MQPPLLRSRVAGYRPFHIDPIAAKETPFGGLIASGWHTCAMYVRLMYDGILNNSSSQGASGMEELRWIAPVRPGEMLTAKYTVLETKRSSTKPYHGTVRFQSEMLNQDDVVVLGMMGRGLYRTRDGLGAVQL
jgi:acyl dehydratase